MRVFGNGSLIAPVAAAVLFASAAVAQPSAEPAPGGAGTSEADVQALEAAVQRYTEDGAEFRRDLENVFRREIERRRESIDQSYGKEARKLEEVLRDRRKEAIASFERFLSRYPDNAEYSAEILFRLGELYYEDTQDTYQLALPEYEIQHGLWERGKIPDEPKEPEKDYSRSIQAYRTLLDRFPKFVNSDAALYALGYCLEDMGERERAQEAFREIIQKYPKSRWVNQAWLLIGEYYFDIGKYRESIDAYKGAIEGASARNYEMALYKLAWSYFQMYDYPTAIGTFKKLIDHIDNAKTKGGLGMQLRQEAVDYLGVSLADDDWNGDGEKDPDATVERAVGYLSEGRPYEREVLEKYADTLYGMYEVAKFPLAIQAYRAVIAREPTHAGNAAVKEKIISVYDLMKDSEKMIIERLDMVQAFGPGSAWYETNKKRPEVLARVDRQLELALSQAAQFHHKRAQDFKAQYAQTRNEESNIASIQEYKEAARIYADYLRRFPDTKYSYEMAYYQADCLFFSFDFALAEGAYKRVRDWNGKDEYLERAAFNAIMSIEKEAQKQLADGRIQKSDLPGETSEMPEVKPSQEEGKVKVEGQPLPKLTQDWIVNVDWYLNKNLTRAKDPDLRPRLSYRVAMEYYRRYNLDEARRRFEKILDEFPQSVFAASSAMAIIDSYRMENDWENIAAWTTKVKEKNIGDAKAIGALQEELRLYQLGARFKEAERLYEAKEYVKAADTFVAVVDSDPKMKVADQALQNAASAYQQAAYYDSAARIYQRIVTDYPDSKYVEGSLFQLAENSRKFFDFEKAVSTYDALRSRFPKSERIPYAMYKTAELLEAQGRLQEASRAYERWASAYPNDPVVGSILFKTAELNERLGNRDEAVRFYRDFVKKFGGKSENNERVVEAIARVAEIQKGAGQLRDWEASQKAVIAEFERRGLKPGTPVSRYPARARFLFIEPKFREYEAIQFKGDLKTQGKLIQQKVKLLDELEREYAEVMPYLHPEWMAAATFRLAEIHDLFAKALFKADVPPMSQEEEDIYRTAIEDKAMIYQQTAQARYVQLIEQGRQRKLDNEWTRKAVESMNRFDPQRFPLYKEEHRVLDYKVRVAPVFEESL